MCVCVCVKILFLVGIFSNSKLVEILIRSPSEKLKHVKNGSIKIWVTCLETLLLFLLCFGYFTGKS